MIGALPMPAGSNPEGVAETLASITGTLFRAIANPDSERAEALAALREAVRQSD